MHEEEEIQGTLSWNGHGTVIKRKCTRKRRFKANSPGMGEVPRYRGNARGRGGSRNTLLEWARYRDID